MTMHVPVRLGPAELTLIDQLVAAGQGAEAERFALSGLPTRKVESYHYTDLKMLLRSVPELAGAATSPGPTPFEIPGAYRLMLANGALQASAPAPDGVIVGRGTGPVLTTRDDVVVRLNNALVGQHLNLGISGDVEQVIQIDRRTEGAAAHALSAAKIFVAGHSRVVILEVFSGSPEAHVGNHATYLTLGANAEVTHITLDLSSPVGTHFATNEYVLAEGAKLRTVVIHADAKLARTQLFPRYAGKGAYADITGLNLVADGQHADITMDALHAVPHTSGKPLFKSIARGRSRAVVQGRLVVARDAQKTDAKLMAQGLMLSDEAEILCKPELEIYADDVVCGHGSTCGRLDDDSLFYLMSRGIPQAEAETMLVRAFLAELFDPLENEALHDALVAVTEGWLRA